MIKAITFDLDGVYFVNGKSNFISNLAQLGISLEEATRVFLKSNEMNTLYKCGLMTDDEYWSWALSEWNLDLSVSEITSLLIQGYEVNSRVMKTVKKVRENGYKTLICSNNFPARINGLQQRFQFLNDFDAAVFSYEIGVTKPRKKIFIELARRAKVETTGIVFADDNDLNLEGARSIGIQTFRFTTFDQFITDLKSVNVNL